MNIEKYINPYERLFVTEILCLIEPDRVLIFYVRFKSAVLTLKPVR
jgi:hypothetical protein